MNPGVLLFCFFTTGIAAVAAAHGLMATAAVAMLFVAFESKDVFS